MKIIVATQTNAEKMAEIAASNGPSFRPFSPSLPFNRIHPLSKVISVLVITG